MKLKRQKTGTGIKILFPKKVLTRPPVLIAQIKSRKKFKQTTKQNQTNISFVFTQKNYQKASRQFNQVIIVI